MGKYDVAREIENGDGFDRASVEEALQKAMTDMLGGGVEIYDSAVPGVIAFERIDIDVQRLGDRLSKDIGIGVVCIANCDWTFDGRHDEEAILIAFDIPSVPDDYRDDWRNEYSPSKPDDASPGL